MCLNISDFCAMAFKYELLKLCILLYSQCQNVQLGKLTLEYDFHQIYYACKPLFGDLYLRNGTLPCVLIDEERNGKYINEYRYKYVDSDFILIYDYD